MVCAGLLGFSALSALTRTATAMSAGSGFMARDGGNATKAVSLIATLQMLEYGGRENLERIEAELSSAFQSVPKNEYGRVDSRSTRYLLQLYFAKERGWQLTGLEPHGFMEDVTAVHEIALVQERSPLLAAAASEMSTSTKGLSLHDVASLASSLERLVLDQSLDLLQAAYKANGFNLQDRLSEKDLHEVLCTHLVLFELADQIEWDHPVRSSKFSELVSVHGMGLEHIVEFERDAFFNDEYARQTEMNPFTNRTFSFDDAARIADGLAGGYGRWQNQECAFMSDHLKVWSQHGLIPLDAFFTPELQDLGFEFTETIQYLEDVGAFDHSTQHVRLANYISGPSNCIPASRYFSVCCMSECDTITQSLMDNIQGPEAAPDDIVAIVSNISSRYVDAPRTLPRSLTQKLEDVAEKHDGLVQMHSRTFAQWLHLAFPDECPFPHIASDKKVLQTDYWRDQLSDTAVPETERLEQVAAVAKKARQAHVSKFAAHHHWSDDEVFYLSHPKPKFSVKRLFNVLRWVPALALLAVGIRHAWHVLRVASNAERDNSELKKPGGRSYGTYSSASFDLSV